ncbi:P-loop containing nucleoside triphosphate hydrolase protein [Serendipita vermifera]|nr:P-loop containing nucleoside triphosphate hydrolase protein [Serendipita vermifera]
MTIMDVSSPVSEKAPLLVEDASKEDTTETPSEKKEEKKDATEAEIKIRTLDIGVWRVFYQATPWGFLPGADTMKSLKETAEGMSYAWRLVKDLWALAPGYLLLWAFLQIWGSVESALGLWMTARMLQTMQDIIMNNKADMRAVRITFGLKCLQIISEWLHRMLSAMCRKVLDKRIAKHCGLKLLDAYTRMDLVTLQRKDVQSKFNKMSSTIMGDLVWREFGELVEQITGLIDMASQASFLISFFMTQENGKSLAVVCILPQVVQRLLYDNWFNGVWFAVAMNKAYLRLRAVGDTARNKSFFEEIISSGLGQYIQKEYNTAMEALGDTPYRHFYTIMWNERNLWKDLVNILVNDISLIYYLAAVAWNPSSFSLTSLTVLRESTNSFAWTLYRLFYGDNTINEKVLFIKDYYGLLEMENEMKDGEITYPPEETKEQDGMRVEFKNVSMKYPHSENFALKNVSFTIPAGSTVILVGANGSGKTTTVSLLSRLLDISSGEILIDDKPISAYRATSLRESQAVLRQGYQHFPFSVRENIGMGDPNWLDLSRQPDQARHIEERIMRAAKMGGADEIMEDIKTMDKKRKDAFKKLKIESQSSWLGGLSVHGPSDTNTPPNEKTDANERKGDVTPEEEKTEGWDANVNPVMTWEGSWQLRGSKLSDMSEEIEKNIELSGGQWQRLALARLFMRADREQVRLICTDEPSAALDPRAEFDVFQSLRTLRGRKTTKIFITHRFGHLTKHADIILCLKKGELVEYGNHDELMKLGGEYATLYNIQAQAFQSS